jgi:hypothetical protein
MLRCSIIALVLSAHAALAAPPAVPERPARVRDNGQRVTLSVEFPELFDAALARRLDSGLATTVVTRAYLTAEGSARAEALAVQTVRVAYDLWDEVYVVEISDERGRRVVREQKRQAALARLAALDALPIVDSARLSAGARYRLAVIVEVNPVSPALLGQVRRWLSRPRDSGPTDGESAFGSFVSLFVNIKVGEAERVLRFRTPPFSRGASP